jgi:hypothetical protein
MGGIPKGFKCKQCEEKGEAGVLRLINEIAPTYGLYKCDKDHEERIRYSDWERVDINDEFGNTRVFFEPI